MADCQYAEVLEKAKAELAVAKAEMFEVESRIERLEQTVIALTSLLEQPAALDPVKGVTEGVRAALRLVAPRGLYPPTVRLQLENAGFHFANQKNPMASIHAGPSGSRARARSAPDRRQGRPPITGIRMTLSGAGRAKGIRLLP